MTIEEALKVLRNEKACVMRNIDGCDRDCAKCDLVLPDGEILAGYDKAIEALEAMVTECEAASMTDTKQALEACAAEDCDRCPLRRDDRCITNLAKGTLKLIERLEARDKA